ncbi:phosphotransferase family protein [Sphingomonas sp. CGMCC 1.13654]|uniref:Phosphotransferase family protein n=2 Tax=Sphingomonas chungangi TaxID=2683589 RepID=A0A838L3V1_9SPHN|nr:phosphotransferase family protein [Sphingomonas chungangi]MVW55184.1 phosphotransferase [Sphingomonas chungangi]
MRDYVEGFAGPLRIEQFRGGQSNPTFKLETPGRNYVLRRKPPGLLVKSAHAVDREYRVIAALHGAGFPVARPFALCEDDAVIGSAFYVMEHVEGRIFWGSTFSTAPREERPACFMAMNRTLADLHGIDPATIGLGDYGRPAGYCARQIARLSCQYEEDEAAGRVEAMDRLIAWLPENIPPDEETSIVHGDFRCDNMIFHPTEPRVIAVLDWELSTLGPPLADFAFHGMMYRMPPEISTGLLGIDLAAANIPGEAEYIATYCRNSRRDGVAGYDFYVAFNMFRLAAIIHGIRGRLARGTASSDHAADIAKRVEPLAALAWHQAIRAGAR